MADGDETMLRNALDAVDRARRWTMIGVGALFIAMAIGVAALFGVAAHTGRNASGDALMLKSLYVASAAQMLFVACCTALVMFQLTRTARTLLRSLESFQKPRG